MAVLVNSKQFRNPISGSFTGSFVGNLTGTSSYTTTASYALTSSYADNFTVGNTLTAQRIVVQTISSSVAYNSGSNRFGSDLTNTQTFTGSVGITGSLSANSFTDGILTISAAQINRTGGNVELQYGGSSGVRIFGAGSNPIVFNSSTGNVQIGTTSTDNGAKLQISGSITAASALARGVTISPTLVASANSDVLVGLDINPTFNTGSFTGLSNIGLKSSTRIHISSNLLTFGGGNSADMQIGIGSLISWNQNFGIALSGAVVKAQFFNLTGHLALQNGGTFTDNGYRLQVNGSGSASGSLYVNGLSTFDGIISSSYTPNNPSSSLIVLSGSIQPSASLGGTSAMYVNTVLSASANSQTLVGLDINPQWNTGSFTGVQNYWFRAGTVRIGYNGLNEYLNFTNQINIARNGEVLFAGYTTGTTISSRSTSTPIIFALNQTITPVGQFFGTSGNFILQNGGTFTDNGYRLQVNGSGSLSGSLFVSGSSVFSGSVDITGSLTVNSTSAILGSGTTNYLPKFTGTTALGNSNIQDSGTLITLGSNTYLGSNSLAIGTSGNYSSNGIQVTNNKLLTGATTAAMIAAYATVQSDVTSTVYGVFIGNYMQAAAFTLSNYYYYYAAQQLTSGGSTITNQYGYYVGNLAAGTNNYSFYGSTTTGTNKWNLYMNGNADNYLAGSLGIGSTGLTAYSLRVVKNITGNVFSYGISQSGIVQSDVTSAAWGFANQLYTQATTFTLSSYYHYFAQQQTIGANSTVNNQSGFHVDSTLTGATNNYAFKGQIPSGVNRWNIYMDGTANNYMAGALGIGTTSFLNYINLVILKNITGATSSQAVNQSGTVQSDVTVESVGFYNTAFTQATSFTLGSYVHFLANQATLGAGSAITNQTGYLVGPTLIGASNNFGFRGRIPTQTNAWNIYMDGTANNYMAGSLLIGSTTDNGEKLQVTGTTRLNGSTSVSGSLFVSGSSLFTGSVDITGSLTMSGDIVPSADNIRSLGKAIFDYNTVWTRKVRSSGGLTFQTDSYNFYSGTTFTEILRINAVSSSFIFQNGGTFNDNGYRVQVNGSGSASGSLFVSGSSVFSGSVNISGSLTTNGTITAQTLVVQTISSSVEYASGSNIFGSLLTNTQSFTGSVGITGSLTVADLLQAKYYYSQTGLESYFGSGQNQALNFVINNTIYGRFIPTSGNFILQKGGSFTDNGYRLQVNGSGSVSGSLYVNGLSTFDGIISSSYTTNNPSSSLLLISGSITPSASLGGASAMYVNTVLSASANSQTLVGLDINPTFTNGAFTGTTNIALRHTGNIIPSSNIVYDLGSVSNNYLRVRVQNIVSNAALSMWAQGPSSALEFGRFHPTTGNLTLQNGGTFTDNGYRLQVNGSGSLSGSLFVSGSSVFNGTATIISASLNYQENLAVTTGSFQTITSAATGSFRAAFFDYVAYSASVVRAGTVISTWSGSVTEYYENYTNDLGGNTAVVTLQTAISGSNIQLQAGISGSAWSVRSLVRLL